MPLSHFIKISIRHLKRDKSSFFINVIGLSTGLACALLILLWVHDEYSKDKFHELDERLFSVMEFQEYSSGLSATRSTPGLLAEALAEEIPEIEYAAMMDWGTDWTLTVGDRNLKRDGRHVGKDFLKLFTFPLIQGDPDKALLDPTSVVISRSTAEALFGSIDEAIGSTIKFQHEEDLMVTGVFEDIGAESSFRFDLLLTWEKFLNENNWAREWGNNGPHTYALLVEGANANDVTAKIKDFVKGKDENDSNVTLFLKQFSERYLYGRYENGVQAGGRIEYVRLFSLIAIFILVIAAINFMNLSTARASKRAKEVGVKRSIGATKGSLILQYLTESVLISMFSLILALGLACLALPQFNLLTEKEMMLIPDIRILLGFVLLAFVTGLVAGSYPALYLSGFKPVEVLKGTIRTSAGEVWARKGLVVFQFAISVFLIASVAIIYKQIHFVQNKNLGYDKDQIVMVDMDGTLNEQYDVFIDLLKQQPGIANASSIGHSLVGRNNNTSGLSWPGKNPEDRILFENFASNYGAMETMGVEMKAGRMFSRDYGMDSAKIIFNEAAIKVMGIEDPIGKTVKLWERYDREIIGVVKDFHFQSLHEPIKPLFFRLTPDNTWHLMASLEKGRESEGLENFQSIYESFNPGFPFSPWFVDEDFASLYAAEQRVSSLSQYFAGIAIIISCLGLFGLAAFTAERRRKEIGIRKVLGASVTNIVSLLTGEFSKLVVISLIIGLPVSYYVLTNWLDRFEFHVAMSAWVFVLAGLTVIIIAWLTVSSQAYRSAIVNPGDCLQDE